MTDLSKLAAGLSAAQRELLIEGGSTVRAYRPAQKLLELGLWHDRGDEYTIWPDYTDIGLALRTHLEGQK